MERGELPQSEPALHSQISLFYLFDAHLLVLPGADGTVSIKNKLHACIIGLLDTSIASFKFFIKKRPNLVHR